jgi:hypothetical protein
MAKSKEPFDKRRVLDRERIDVSDQLLGGKSTSKVVPPDS